MRLFGYHPGATVRSTLREDARRWVRGLFSNEAAPDSLSSREPPVDGRRVRAYFDREYAIGEESPEKDIPPLVTLRRLVQAALVALHVAGNSLARGGSSELRNRVSGLVLRPLSLVVGAIHGFLTVIVQGRAAAAAAHTVAWAAIVLAAFLVYYRYALGQAVPDALWGLALTVGGIALLFEVIWSWLRPRLHAAMWTLAAVSAAMLAWHFGVTELPGSLYLLFLTLGAGAVVFEGVFRLLRAPSRGAAVAAVHLISWLLIAAGAAALFFLERDAAGSQAQLNLLWGAVFLAAGLLFLQAVFGWWAAWYEERHASLRTSLWVLVLSAATIAGYDLYAWFQRLEEQERVSSPLLQASLAILGWSLLFGLLAAGLRSWRAAFVTFLAAFGFSVLAAWPPAAPWLNMVTLPLAGGLAVAGLALAVGALLPGRPSVPLSILPWFWKAVGFAVFAVASIACMVLLSLSGPNVVPLQFAGTVDRAAQIVREWAAQDRLEQAFFGLYFDFVLIAAYVATFFLAGVLLAEKSLPRLPRLAHAALLVAWGGVAAGALDIVENLALLGILYGLLAEWDWLPAVARWCALYKFPLVGAGFIAALIALGVLLRDRFRPSPPAAATPPAAAAGGEG